MSSTALTIAETFENHPAIEKVSYPFLKSHEGHELAKQQMKGGGSTVAIQFKADKDSVFRFMNALQVIDISNNLGDSKSLMTHPSSTTHRRLSLEIQAEMGITPSTVRLSVGLEHPEDLVRDIETALKSI
jgi:O-succinylhomoserine sulfhydrylase